MTRKPIEIVKQWQTYYMVKLARKYYCVGHDATTLETWAIAPPDRDAISREYRRASGWTHEAIEAVAIGRKEETAINYFNSAIRRARFEEAALARQTDQAMRFYTINEVSRLAGISYVAVKRNIAKAGLTIQVVSAEQLSSRQGRHKDAAAIDETQFAAFLEFVAAQKARTCATHTAQA
jgi:hypothetical protein